MHNQYQPLTQNPIWLRDTANAVGRMDPMLRGLVTDKGSLTANLVALSEGEFEVNVLRQCITLPYFHEQRKLQRPLARAAMIREVELMVHQIPVVFARSVVPLKLVSKGRGGLANLGRTPLGHLLFKNGRIRVSKREFSMPYFADQRITARRTPYDYQGSTILVSEFFLPTIAELIEGQKV